MFRILRKKKGQNTAEYAILIALIVATAVAMQTYIKRGLQGRLRDATDKFATETSGIGSTTQYEPYYLDTNFDTTAGSTVKESELTGGGVDRDTTREHTERTGRQIYLAPTSE